MNARIITTGGFLSILLLMGCQEKDYLVTISTSFGDMKMVLYDETPMHKESFVRLASTGEYDSTIFHRVMEEFMIQGGDLNQRPGNTEQDNTLIDAEFRPALIHTRGMVAGARTPDNVNPEKRSGVQFYIVQGKKFGRQELDQMIEDGYYATCVTRLNQLFQQGRNRDLLDQLIELQKQNDVEGVRELVYANRGLIESEFGAIPRKEYNDEQYELYETVGGAPHLDWEYTVFGQVVEGLEVVDAIAAVQKGPANRPVEDIYMVMSVEEVTKKKLTELYGIAYPESQ